MLICPNCDETRRGLEEIREHHIEVHGYDCFPHGLKYDSIDLECDYCGETKSRPLSHLKSNHFHFCSRDCMLTVRRNKKDVDFDDYGENWLEIREKVLERDNYTCQRCGKEEDECSSVQVHHETPVKEFDSPEKANKLENLATYCGNCHHIKEMEGWIRETKQEAET